jgi:hypothetical protein
MDGHALAQAGHFAQGPCLEMRTAFVNDPGQFVEVRETLHEPDYAA